MDYYYLFRYRKTMNRSDFYSLQDSFYREPREWISTHEIKEYKVLRMNYDLNYTLSMRLIFQMNVYLAKKYCIISITFAN